jgi:hypothetical protein
MNPDERILKTVKVGEGSSAFRVALHSEPAQAPAYHLPCLLLLGVTLCGCSSTEVSYLEPFCGIVGHEISLSTTTTLTEAGKVNNRRNVPFGLGRLSDPKFKSSVKLPATHTVTIDSVRDEVVFEHEFIIAYGRTRHPETGKEVSFAYCWGTDWLLGRAPWEAETVPPMRYPAFRLPAHFNYPTFFGAAAPPTNAVLWGKEPCSK